MPKWGKPTAESDLPKHMPNAVERDNILGAASSRLTDIKRI
jgi:hypothetical protein